MKFLILMPLLVFLTPFYAQALAPFDLELKANPKAECEPLDPNSNNRFTCCVKMAQQIELDQQNVLHLKADKKLCLDPLLQDMKFTLVNARPNGINVFELSSPRIEDTPFRSYSGRPTKFWIAINSYFSFPERQYLTNGVHSFISAPLAVDQTLPDGSVKTTFGGFDAELSTILGWKYLSAVVLSEKTESYDCSNPRQPHLICTDRIQMVEQTWLNQMTNELTKRQVEFRKTISQD